MFGRVASGRHPMVDFEVASMYGGVRGHDVKAPSQDPHTSKYAQLHCQSSKVIKLDSYKVVSTLSMSCMILLHDLVAGMQYVQSLSRTSSNTSEA